MKQVDCRKLKIQGLEILKEKIKGENINLKVIQIEGDKASDLYVSNKKKAASFVGIKADHVLLPNDIKEDDLKSLIKNFNNDESVNGIMVQLPIPAHLDADDVIETIDKDKDVDGLTSQNLGRIMSKKEGLKPCTAEGIMNILDACIGLKNLEGKNATIIGRTKLVGLPLFHMLLAYNVTPTICHTKTKKLEQFTKNADILITAAGQENPFIGQDMIKENSVVIDVSTVRDESGKFHGDVLYDEVIDKAGYVTPVPGGVGQLTVLELMNNTYKAYVLQKKRKK